MLVILGQRYVGPDLRGRIAQPHCVDVAGNDVGVRLAFKAARENCRVESIGEAILKNRGQRRVADSALRTRNQRFNRRAGKVAFALGRARVRKLRPQRNPGIQICPGKHPCGSRPFQQLSPADFTHCLSPFRTRRSKVIAKVSMISVMANLTLIYGLRLLPEGEVTEIQDATLKLANGHQAHVTMHTIEGSREEIETQLKRSLDAFFDFYPEI